MVLPYTIFIRLVWNFLLPIAPKGSKAARLYTGSRAALASLKGTADRREGRSVVWMHCASLGEFEQGRPVLESIRKSHPECFIHVSFFSPSGYEAVGLHPLLDSVSYLPPDLPSEARSFLQQLKPSLIVWVRYDFWYWILKEAAQSGAHCICISALFRPSQPYFRHWGGFFRSMLRRFNHLFVQNQATFDLLQKAGFSNVSISGDTRFDRVWEQALAAEALRDFELWAAGKPLLVAGSVWPEDMAVLGKVLTQLPDFSIVIAPHEVGNEGVKACLRHVEEQYGLYTKRDWTHRIVVLNTVGILSRLYRYANVAYVGGAFGQGLHNCLEPAAFGVGLLFGPQIEQYPEAIELEKIGAAIRVQTPDECLRAVQEVVSKPDMGALATQFVQQRVGATHSIVRYLNAAWKG